MQFRPCIDIHNGKVKQIIGSSLQDEGDQAEENFVSRHEASYYAELYREKGLAGGHVILLNAQDSIYYEETRKQAVLALQAFPGGMQLGGGITTENAMEFLRAGASHVIISSYVFKGGRILENRLRSLVQIVGEKHLVLDLSCRKQGDVYYIATDRWQTMTEIPVNLETLEKLSVYCDEFLIHAADVEGKNSGVDAGLIELLSGWNGAPVTYAGGVHDMQDIRLLNEKGHGRIHFTVGTALDLFGGSLPFEEILCLSETEKSMNV